MSAEPQYICFVGCYRTASGLTSRGGRKRGISPATGFAENGIAGPRAFPTPITSNNDAKDALAQARCGAVCFVGCHRGRAHITRPVDGEPLRGKKV